MVDNQGRKNRRTNNTFLSKEAGPPESKVQDKHTNGLDKPKLVGTVAEKTKLEQTILLPHHTPEPPLRENKVTQQYTPERAREGTQRLREGLQGKTKLEEILIDIVVFEHYVIAGFKVKINPPTKTEDDSLTTNPPNPKSDKYPTIIRAKGAPSIKAFSLGKWGGSKIGLASGREAKPVPDSRRNPAPAVKSPAAK